MGIAKKAAPNISLREWVELGMREGQRDREKLITAKQTNKNEQNRTHTETEKKQPTATTTKQNA